MDKNTLWLKLDQGFSTPSCDFRHTASSMPRFNSNQNAQGMLHVQKWRLRGHASGSFETAARKPSGTRGSNLPDLESRRCFFVLFFLFVFCFWNKDQEFCLELRPWISSEVDVWSFIYVWSLLEVFRKLVSGVLFLTQTMDVFWSNLGIRSFICYRDNVFWSWCQESHLE